MGDSEIHIFNLRFSSYYQFMLSSKARTSVKQEKYLEYKSQGDNYIQGLAAQGPGPGSVIKSH